MSYKVFVRKVPKNASEVYIRYAFEESFGEVIDVTIPKDPYTYKPRGFVYVTFKNKSSMDAALNAGTCRVMDTSVEINTVEAKKRGKQCQRLYVKGLPTDSNEKDLIDFFQSLGHLNLKIFPRDRNTGLLRNFCYLTYDSEETNKLLSDGIITMGSYTFTVVPAQRRDELYPDSYDKPIANKVDELMNAGNEEYDPLQHPASNSGNPPSYSDQYGYDYSSYYPNYDGQYYDPNYESHYYDPNNPYANYGYYSYSSAAPNPAYATPSEIENKKASEAPKTDYGYPMDSKQMDSYGYTQDTNSSQQQSQQPPHSPPPHDPYGQPQQPPHDPYGQPQQPPHNPPPHDPYSQPQQPPHSPPPHDPYGQPQQPPHNPPPHDPYGQPQQPPHSPPPHDPYSQPQQPPYDPYSQPQQPPHNPPHDYHGQPQQPPYPYGQPQQPPYDPYGQPPNSYGQAPYDLYNQPPRGHDIPRNNTRWDQGGHGAPPRRHESRWDKRDSPPNRDYHDDRGHNTHNHRYDDGERRIGFDKRDRNGYDDRDRRGSHSNRERRSSFDDNRYRDRSRSRDRGSSYPQREFIDNTRIFIQGLPPTATEKDVRDHFGQYGHIVNVSFPINHNTGMQRDIAFITVERPEDADQIIRDAPRTIMGVTLKDVCKARTKTRRY